ncbi:hypothetical protein [Streptomyces monashensis]|uniref:Uncharacterized protein n=1 Tax=Streptomyces monashensis TaxID=1678012 RepID=A0A1S2P064_9ACTN|nr:hypothetical protein [Streptomyces monashensis]OIJ86946.1 hypothetical protein BIV23_43370 [Streptomyces monashensis]
MHMFWVVATAVVFGLLAAAGVAGVTTGWVAPWGRARVLRPKLWGYGCLLGAAGWGVFIWLGPLDGGHDLLAWLGWIGIMAALRLRVLSERPGRGATTTSTTSAS